MSDTVKVGDKIRFSTELLKQIDEMPDRQSKLVTVTRIEEHDDEGAKVLYLEVADKP